MEVLREQHGLSSSSERSIAVVQCCPIPLPAITWGAKRLNVLDVVRGVWTGHGDNVILSESPACPTTNATKSESSAEIRPFLFCMRSAQLWVRVLCYVMFYFCSFPRLKGLFNRCAIPFRIFLSPCLSPLSVSTRGIILRPGLILHSFPSFRVSSFPFSQRNSLPFSLSNERRMLFFWSPNSSRHSASSGNAGRGLGTHVHPSFFDTTGTEPSSWACPSLEVFS